jgi:hypothetical protein
MVDIWQLQANSLPVTPSRLGIISQELDGEAYHTTFNNFYPGANSSFAAYRNQSLLLTTEGTPLIFDQEIFDSGADEYNPVGGTFTSEYGGIYLISMYFSTIAVSATFFGASVTFVITDGDPPSLRLYTLNDDLAATSKRHAISMSAVVTLSAGGIIAPPTVYSTPATSVVVGNGFNLFSGTKVG